MRAIIFLIVLVVAVVLVLQATGGIYIGTVDGGGLTVNGRRVASERVCRYLTMNGIKETPGGGRIGELSVSRDCPLFYDPQN